MTQVVTFVYTDWLSQYPQFTNVASDQAQNYFNQACLYCDNTSASPILVSSDVPTLTMLLYMLTSHVAALWAQYTSGQTSGLVGRIGSASEGSVSVQTVYTTPTSSLQAWLEQTPYGASYWAATLRYRAATYIPPSSKVMVIW